MLLLVAVVLLGAAVYVIREVITLPVQEREGSLRRARAYGREQLMRRPREESLRERALVPAKETIARLVLRVNPKLTMEQVSFRLLAAGLGRRVSPTAFLAGKGFLTIGGFVFGILFGGVAGAGGLTIMLAIGLAATGFIAPDFIVSRKIQSRSERIRADLPDALDILAVSVEAGLGFDGAVAKLIEATEGPLAEEFELTLNEMRIGESRQDALKKLAQRVAAPEVSNFTRAIIQADQFGISLGRILKVQAGDTRVRRQLAAEEKAMKAPVKMLFPTVLFIFPSMFMVILGPAFLNITKIF